MVRTSPRTTSALNDVLARTQGGTTDRHGRFRCNYCGCYYNPQAGCASRYHRFLAAAEHAAATLGLTHGRDADTGVHTRVAGALALARTPRRSKAAENLGRLLGRVRATLARAGDAGRTGTAARELEQGRHGSHLRLMA